MMTRLREEASHTDTYDGLLDYMQNTWIDSTLWTPDRWSVFYRTVRTNNDVDGWHHRRLNQNPQKDQLPLYVMIQLLFQEATTVNLQMRRRDKIRRRQSKKYRDLQGKIMKYWEQYAGGQKTPNSLLRSCAHLNAPTLWTAHTRLFNVLYILCIFMYISYIIMWPANVNLMLLGLCLNVLKWIICFILCIFHVL